MISDDDRLPRYPICHILDTIGNHYSVYPNQGIHWTMINDVMHQVSILYISALDEAHQQKTTEICTRRFTEQKQHLGIESGDHWGALGHDGSLSEGNHLKPGNPIIGNIGNAFATLRMRKRVVHCLRKLQWKIKTAHC